MTQEELQSYILQKYPGFKLEPLAHDLTFLVPAEQYIPFCTFLKEDPSMAFQNVMSLTATDYLDYMQVVVHINSYSQKHRIAIKVTLDRENPKISTITHLWPGANWHERETYDLYGVLFDKHPDLRRILLADDWEGYPMRKGYTHWNLTPMPDDVTEVMKDYPTVPNPLG